MAEPLYIMAAEWTTDAGCMPGNGTPMCAGDGAFDEADEEIVSCSPIDSSTLGKKGEKVFIYVRVQDSVGRWNTRRGLTEYTWYGNEEPGAAPGEWVCDPDRAWPPEDEGWGWVIIGPACTTQPFGDYDFDCNIGLDDYTAICVGFQVVPMHGCFRGPGTTYGTQCKIFDFDIDGDIDLQDFAGFQQAFEEP